ncbi:MAG: hypothetical protein R6U46_11910 [Marinilabilia sp.]
MGKRNVNLIIFCFVGLVLQAQYQPDLSGFDEEIERHIVKGSAKYVFDDVSTIEDTLFGRPIEEVKTQQSEQKTGFFSKIFKKEEEKQETQKYGESLIEEILKDVHASFKPSQERSFSEAKRFFLTVDSVVKTHGVKITNGLSGPLNQELSSWNPGFDCDLMALVYSTAAQKYPFEISFSFYPGPHVFSRYMLNDSTYYNWEATTEKHISDKEYRKHSGLPKDSNSGVWFDYLKTIDSKQALSIIFYNESERETDKGNHRRALNYLNVANQLVPEFELYVKKSMDVLDSLERWSELKTRSSEIMDFDSTSYMGYYYQGEAFSGMNQTDSAFYYYNKAIEKNPDFGLLYYTRGMEHLKNDDYDAAVEDFENLKNLKKKWYNHDYLKAFSKKLSVYEERNDSDCDEE